MSFFAVKKPLIRLTILVGLLALAWLLWQPGKSVTDGRHDLGNNAIWLQHGWIGDDAWFERNQRDRSKFRNREAMQALADQLRAHGIRKVYPHVCPCSRLGPLPGVDPVQTEAFLDVFEDFEVIPWIGGVHLKHCPVSKPTWRSAFIASANDLLKAHPRFAGVQVNIEPMPNGTASYIDLLRELKAALPATPGQRPPILSVAGLSTAHPLASVRECALGRDVFPPSNGRMRRSRGDDVRHRNSNSESL